MVDAAVLTTRLLLAAVFGLAGVTKLLDRGGSRRALRSFGVSARVASALAVALPLAELAVAGLLLTSRGALIGALAAAGLLLTFGAAIAINLARGRTPDCHCFGQLHSAPAGWTTLARNGVLGALAGGLAVAEWNGAGPSAVAWVGRLEPTEGVAGAVAATLVVVAIAGRSRLLQLLQQDGRLGVRLARIEGDLGELRIDFAADEPELGLPVGSAAPAFELSDMAGCTVSSTELRTAGHPLALVFVDPGCGPCQDLAPEIARWQREHGDALTDRRIEQRYARAGALGGARARPRAGAARRAAQPLLLLSSRRHAQRGVGGLRRSNRQPARHRCRRDHGAR